MAPTETAIHDLWHQALGMAFGFAKAARTAELRGDRRVRGFDGRGLHMYSTEWGRVWMCEELLPDLESLRTMDPITMRAAAAREAEEEFIADALKGEVDWHRT